MKYDFILQPDLCEVETFEHLVRFLKTAISSVVFSQAYLAVLHLDYNSKDACWTINNGVSAMPGCIYVRTWAKTRDSHLALDHKQ